MITKSNHEEAWMHTPVRLARKSDHNSWYIKQIQNVFSWSITITACLPSSIPISYLLSNMHAIKFSVLALFASMSTASAVPPLEARDDSATVRTFGGDACNGAVNTFTLVGSGSYRCAAVPSGKRSISVSGRYVAPIA